MVLASSTSVPDVTMQSLAISALSRRITRKFSASVFVRQASKKGNSQYSGQAITVTDVDL